MAVFREFVEVKQAPVDEFRGNVPTCFDHAGNSVERLHSPIRMAEYGQGVRESPGLDSKIVATVKRNDGFEVSRLKRHRGIWASRIATIHRVARRICSSPVSTRAFGPVPLGFVTFRHDGLQGGDSGEQGMIRALRGRASAFNCRQSMAGHAETQIPAAGTSGCPGRRR